MRIPSRIAGLYALFGALWIVLSDRAVQLITEDPQRLVRLQTMKGWSFIAVTAILLFYLVRQQVAALQQLNDDLERRVIERTKRLEQANQELEAFSFTVSHDLKAPLRRIDSFSQLLSDRFKAALPETAAHYVDRIQEATAQMILLIDDLLTYSRVDKKELELSNIALQPILDRLLKERKEQIDERQAVIEINLECDQVHGNSDGLLLVLRNLLDNALKFTADRAPRISITSKAMGNQCTISFSDNGIGFAPEFSEKIFLIFQRLHPESEYPGTGIGLAIVSKATQRMRGTITAISEEGKGATFLLALPLK